MMEPLHVFVFVVGWCSRSTFLPVVSTEIEVVQIAEVVDYDFKIFGTLDKETDIGKFESVAIERDVSRSVVCNFKPSFRPEDKGGKMIIPFTCEHASNCTNPYDSRWTNITCADYARTEGLQGEYICCPLNAVTSYTNYPNRLITPDVPDYTYYEYREIPTNFKRHTKTPYSSLYGGITERIIDAPTINSSVNPDHVNRLQKEIVCGFKPGQRIYREDPDPNDRELTEEVFYRSPFFCVPQGKCRKDQQDPDRKPERGWEIFCHNMIKPRPEQEGKTVCCSAYDIDEDVFGFKYVNLPQLPLYLKYSPGLRSAYKCEEYSKLVCEGEENTCAKGGGHGFPQKGENPHMAVLGFVVPKFLLLHCGGTLISTRYVISSATCSKYYGYTTNVVLLGEYSVPEVQEEIKYEKTYLIVEILPYQRSGFRLKKGEQPQTASNLIVDLALYRTDVDVDLSPLLRPACIFHHLRTWPDDLDFLGFGSPEKDVHKNEFIKTLSLPYMDRMDCVGHDRFPDVRENPFYGVYGVKEDYMMCYGSIHQPIIAPCQYDVGGPLQIKQDYPFCTTQLMGVLSSLRDLPCTRKMPSVFINISHFIEEIEDQVWGDYTFLDIYDKDFHKPTCVTPYNMTFFNRCEDGSSCRPPFA